MKLPAIKTIIVKIALTVMAGFIFNWLHFPVAWLLGPMIAGIAYALIQGTPQPLPQLVITIGKAILGIATAFRFSPETIGVITTYAIPVVGCILMTAALSLFKGYLLSRWSGVSRATGFLASIPGTAPAIVAMSEELGADVIAVALLQYLRLFLVILVVPTAVIFMFPANPVTQTTATVATVSNSTIPLWFNLLMLTGCCLLGMWGGKKLRLPTSSFLGSFIVGLIASWLIPYELQVPQWLFATALMLMGVSVGVQFDWENARKLWKAVLIEVGLVLALILACFGIGYQFHHLTNVDLMTSLLSFTPGGLEAMIATVNELGGDAGLVSAIQLTRMLIIILVAPALTTLVVKGIKSGDD